MERGANLNSSRANSPNLPSKLEVVGGKNLKDMKVIYMQETLQFMANGRTREVEKLIASGEVKQTEEGISYLLTIIEDEDRGSTVV